MFIGRATHLKRFEEIIAGDDDARTRILLVFGPQGTGKRTVLEMFRAAALRRSNTYCGPVCDLTRPRDLGEMLEEIVAGLEAPDGHFDDFTRTLRRTRDKAKGHKPWYARAAETAEGAAVEVNTVAPHWTTGTARLATGVIRDAVDWWDDASSHSSITDEFVKDLRGLAGAKQTPVVLLFNGLDRHPVDPVVRWLRTDLPAQVADVPVTLVFAAEYVDTIYDDLRSRGATVDRMPVEAFTPAETNEFIQRNLDIDPNSRLGRQIAEESGNLPAWLTRLQRYFAEHDKPEGDELTEDARAAATGGGAELFRRLEDGEQRRLALFSSPMRWFNATLLQSVAEVAGIPSEDDSGPQAVLSLIEMSTRPHWLGPRGGGWGFGAPTQRRALVEELRRVDPEAYWQVHERAERYHRNRLALLDRRAQYELGPDEEPDDVEDAGAPMRRWRRFEDPEYVDELAEWLYHTTALVPDAGFRRLAEEAAEAILHLSPGVVPRLTDVGPELGLGADRMLYLRELAAVDAACNASRFQDAEEMLKRLREMSTPSDLTTASLAVAHGFALINAGRPESEAHEAFATAEHILTGDPGVDSGGAVKGVRALNLTFLAWMSTRTARDEALAHLDTARELADAIGDEKLITHVIRARALVLGGLGGEPSEIEALLEEALTRYRRLGRLKDVASLLRTRAEIRLAGNLSQQARADLTSARELSRQLADADGEAATVVALVVLALREGDDPGADALRDETIQLRPADPYVHNALGNAYFTASRYTRAIELYTAAVDIQPDMVFYANRGRCRWAMDDKASAVEDMKQAFSRASSFELAVELADRCNQIGDTDGAAEAGTYLVRELATLIDAEAHQPALSPSAEVPARVSAAARRAIRVLSPTAVAEVLRLAAVRYPDDLDTHVALLQAAVAAHPEDPQLNFTLGRTLRSRADGADERWNPYWLDRACDALQQAWTLERDADTDSDSRVRYATAYAETLIARRRWTEASDAVADAVATKPDDAAARSLERRLGTLRRRDSYEGGSGHESLASPVIVAVATDVRPFVDPQTTGSHELFEQVLPKLRDAVADATGVLIPGVRVRDDDALPGGSVRFLVHGLVKRELDLRGDYLVSWAPQDPAPERADTTLPWSEDAAAWVTDAELGMLPGAPLVWDRVGSILATLTTVLATERAAFVGLEQTTVRLQDLGLERPPGELAPLTATLRRLVERGASVAELEPILEAVEDRGDRTLEAIVDDLETGLPRVDPTSLVERYARGGDAFVPHAAASIVVRLGGDEAVPDGLLDKLKAIGGTLAEALGLPRPTVAAERAPGLEPGRYDLVIGDAVRVAGTLGGSPKRWLADHPVAGPCGRSASSPAFDPEADTLAPGVQIARDLEEALWHDPGLLLQTTQGRSWLHDIVASAEVPEPARAAATRVIRELASQRVPLAEDALLDELARVDWHVPEGDADAGAPAEAPRVVKRRQLDRDIPDDFALGLRDWVLVQEAGAVADVALTVQIDHSRSTDLRVRLIAPNGVSATVHDFGFQPLGKLRVDSRTDVRLQRLIGQPLAGEWTLSVQDFAAGATGTLVAWALELTSDAVGSASESQLDSTASSDAAQGWPPLCVATERIATKLRPYEVLLQVAPTGVLGLAMNDVMRGLPDLVAEHRARPTAVGMAHEAYKMVADAHVGQDDCIVVINGLPRVRYTAGREDEVETVLRAVALKVAVCEQEASPELLDLTWTQGFLENYAETLPHLVEAIRHGIPDEILALAFGCLADAGISVRDERLLDAMLDYVATTPDPASLDAGAGGSEDARFSPYALVQHVRLALPDCVVGSFAGSPPVAAIALDAELERRLREEIAAAADDPPVYRVAEAAALLRELGEAVARHEVSSEVAVVTARDLRRHVTSLVGAQHPTVAVIAREEAIDLELASGGRLEGEPASTEREGFEPSDEVDPRHTISSRARSAAPAPLLEEVSLAADPLRDED